MAKHQAWTEQGWEERGLAHVIVARERARGVLEVGIFLVDSWCLGVKDAFGDVCTSDELTGLLDEQIPEDRRESMDPACARKLIDGAVAYAQGFGFLPHRDFRKARKVLGGLDATTCPRDFTFGRDGKPCFVAGPYDDEARVNRVAAVLRARLGEDGFELIMAEDDEDLGDGDLERTDDDSEVSPEPGPAARYDEASDAAVDQMLVQGIEAFYEYVLSDETCNTAMSPTESMGFFTGLALLPEMVSPDEWGPVVFGRGSGGGSVEPGIPERMALGALAAQAMVDAQLKRGLVEPSLPGPDEEQHVSFASLTCFGIMQGLSMRPSHLAGLRSRAGAAQALQNIERLAALDPENDPEVQAWLGTRSNLAVVIGKAVAALYAVALEMRPPGATPMEEADGARG